MGKPTLWEIVDIICSFQLDGDKLLDALREEITRNDIKDTEVVSVLEFCIRDLNHQSDNIDNFIKRLENFKKSYSK